MISAICCISDRPDDLLPHFFKHYVSMGVERFYFGIYGAENNDIWRSVQRYAGDLDVRLTRLNTALFFDSVVERKYKTEISAELHHPLYKNSWYVPVDLDEFHTMDGYGSFQHLAEDVQAEGADYVNAWMYDRIASDGSIPAAIRPDISIWEQFPYAEQLSVKILEGKSCASKVMLAKTPIPVRLGHHAPGHMGTEDLYKKFSTDGTTHHFKWFGNAASRERFKYDANNVYNYTWTWEHLRLIDHIAARGGRMF